MSEPSSAAPASDSLIDLAVDNPLLDHLGLRLAEWAPGRCEFRLDIEPRHLNRSGSVQGGVMATLLDAACGYAGLYTDAGTAPANAVTVMLSISYLGRAREGRIRAVGRVTGGGRSVYFSSAELLDEQGRVVATAQGSFKRSAPAPAAPPVAPDAPAPAAAAAGA